MSCNFGQKQLELPDVDEDGFIDFVFSDTSAFPNAGREEPCGVWAVSGAIGHVLWERVERDWPAPHSISGYGQSLLSPADIDGDGIEDVVVWSWGNCVYSSADGSLLFFSPGSEFSD